MLRSFAAAVAGAVAFIGLADTIPVAKKPLIQKRDDINTSASVELSITTKSGTRNDTSPLLYGWMFEDINHSGEGGLYAEMITNRAFQGSTVTTGSIDGLDGYVIISSENPIQPYGPVLTGWSGIGDVRLSLDSLHPLSDTIPTCLRVDVFSNATGEVGILNYGWWGMDVSPQTYNASFYVVANAPVYSGNLTGFNVSLRSNLTNDIWATQHIPLTHNLSTFDYDYFETQIVNTVQAPYSNNTFAITMNASEVAGSTFYFDLISLFPETFKGRKNGLRKDLAQTVYDLKPSFLRFPGGNNLEGYSVLTHWKWNETIGPLRYRKGSFGNWNYWNTNGLGLLEFLEWCEDMEMEPVLAIYAGFSLDIHGSTGTTYPKSKFDELLQDALDEIEYCMGDTNTKYGALRAEHGHPEPVEIRYIEIGNEDYLSNTYSWRLPYFHDGIKAKYPNMKFISTQYDEDKDGAAGGYPYITDGYNVSLPSGALWDTHHYRTPSYFLESFNFYDNWQEETGNTDNGVMIGEYSVFQIDTEDGEIDWTMPVGIHIFYPQLLSAISEGVYLLGAERNPNAVKMSSYAPSLQNFNWYNWTPNLIAFTANPNETICSVSYYQQQLMNTYRGTETLPVTNSKGGFDPLWWGATIDTEKNYIYLKVINSGNSSVPLTADFDVTYSGVNGTILTSDEVSDINYINNRTAVVPQTLNITSASGDTFEWDVPSYSITVLQFDL